jgi:hypothetical protein
MKRVTKSEQVYTHLMKKGVITSLEAINLYGATRLAAIIFNLKKLKKVEIRTESIEVKDRYGNTCKYAKYINKNLNTTTKKSK